MSKTLLAVVVAAFAATFFAGPANAEIYRWCAIYGGNFGGGATNCGFVTLAQCQATISGIGGSCAENQLYTGDHRRRPRKRH